MQARYYALLESTGDNTPPTATTADIGRLAKLEAMMGDPRSAYWADASLQGEYRSILSLTAPETEGE
jgi:hypothetical protein